MFAYFVQAVLDIGAVKGERNVIEVKTRSFQDKEESVTSIASLTLGVTNDMVGLLYLCHALCICNPGSSQYAQWYRSDRHQTCNTYRGD